MLNHEDNQGFNEDIQGQWLLEHLKVNPVVDTLESLRILAGTESIKVSDEWDHYDGFQGFKFTKTNAELYVYAKKPRSKITKVRLFLRSGYGYPLRVYTLYKRHWWN